MAANIVKPRMLSKPRCAPWNYPSWRRQMDVVLCTHSTMSPFPPEYTLSFDFPRAVRHEQYEETLLHFPRAVRHERYEETLVKRKAPAQAQDRACAPRYSGSTRSSQKLKSVLTEFLISASDQGPDPGWIVPPEGMQVPPFQVKCGRSKVTLPDVWVMPKTYPNSDPTFKSQGQPVGLFCGGGMIAAHGKISLYDGDLSQDERCRDASHMYTLRDGGGFYLNGKIDSLEVFNARGRTHSVAMFADDPWPACSTTANARWVHTLDPSRYVRADGEVVLMKLTVWLQAKREITPGEEITVDLGRIQHGMILDESTDS